MTWARNILWLATAFVLGRQSVRIGWHDFAVRQVAILLLVVAVVAIWFGIETIERRVKGKGRAS